MNVEKLVQDAGTKEQAISTFLQKMKTGHISFPFQKFYLDPPAIMFQRLRKVPPQIYYQKNKIRAYYPFRKSIDCYFRGKPVFIMSDTTTYFSHDAISDHFCENVRIKAHRCDSLSPADFWNDSNKMIEVLYEVFKYEIIQAKHLRMAIYEKVSEAKQFRPSWVVGIIKLLFPHSSNLKMIDISSGWGDRLVAAISMNMEYVGCDPNVELMEGHSKIIKTFGDKRMHKVIYKPFEDPSVEFKEDYFDICLTSPPFFDLEIYSQDSNQSCVKFNQIKTWLEGFLFPSLSKAWKSIKVGGYMAIHLGDTYRFRICDPMNHFIDEFLPYSHYKGVIGLAGEKKRPTPVWVWQKNPTHSAFKSPLYGTKFDRMYDEYINPNIAEITLAKK